MQKVPAGHMAGALRRALSWHGAWRYAAPLAMLAAAAAIGHFALPYVGAGGAGSSSAAGSSGDRAVVAAAVVFDLTVALPAVVFGLLVRTRRWPLIVLVPTCMLGYAVATIAMAPQDRAALDVVRILVVPAEIALVVALLVQARRAMTATPATPGGDFVTRFRSAARGAIGHRLAADILTTEVAILRYALGRHMRTGRAQGGEGGAVFTTWKTAAFGPILIGLLMAIVAETLALHVLVQLLSPAAAWVLTGLSVYAALWLIGDYRAMRARPVRVMRSHLALRLGLRWEADVPLDRIASAELLAAAPRQRPKDALTMALVGSPNVRLVFDEPVEVTGLYGLRRTTRKISLRVDDPAGLCAQLARSACD